MGSGCHRAVQSSVRSNMRGHNHRILEIQVAHTSRQKERLTACHRIADLMSSAPPGSWFEAGQDRFRCGSREFPDDPVPNIRDDMRDMELTWN